MLDGQAGSAWGAQYTWAGDYGYWDTVSSNTVWQSGSSYFAWSNSPVSDAVFTTYGFVVGVDAPVTVQNMTFDVDGCWLYSVYGDPVMLAGSTPTINVATGTSQMYLSFAGTSGMTKSGGGTLELDWPDSYSGSTTVSGGVLRLMDPGALPGGTATSGGTSNLVIAGGVVELAAGDFTRTLGTGPDAVQFTASGGFSALGGDRVVNLGGATAQVNWGSGGFLPSGDR